MLGVVDDSGTTGWMKLCIVPEVPDQCMNQNQPRIAKVTTWAGASSCKYSTPKKKNRAKDHLSFEPAAVFFRPPDLLPRLSRSLVSTRSGHLFGPNGLRPTTSAGAGASRISPRGVRFGDGEIRRDWFAAVI